MSIISAIPSVAARSLSRVIAVVVFIALPVTARSQSAVANPAAIAQRVRVSIALDAALPAGAPDVSILRRRHASPHDVIVLSSTAEPAQLARALFLLLAAREVGGDTTATDMRIGVPSAGASSLWEELETPRCARILERLKTMPLRAVPGVGVARSYDLYARPHAFQGKLTRAAR